MLVELKLNDVVPELSFIVSLEIALFSVLLYCAVYPHPASISLGLVKEYRPWLAVANN